MIPTIIVHGTLGSGKTTLLKYLLRLPEFSGSFIIENEFASVNVDQVTLAAHHDVEVYDIAGGCICCSSGAELIDALKGLVDRGWQKPVIIETTGVANSAQLIKQLLLSPVFIDSFSLHKNIYVIDPLETIPAELNEKHYLDVMLADIAIVGKADLASPEVITEIERILIEINPELKVINGQNGSYGLFDSLLATNSNVEHVIIHYMNEILNLDVSSHGMSYTLLTKLDPFASKDIIGDVVKALQNHPHMTVKRIKGYVVDSFGQWWHVEATSHHVAIEPVEIQNESLLVVIGSNINDEEVKNIISII